VLRFGAERFENQEIESALDQVDWLHRTFHMIIDITKLAIL
jgi:hypothetical protein